MDTTKVIAGPPALGNVIERWVLASYSLNLKSYLNRFYLQPDGRYVRCIRWLPNALSLTRLIGTPVVAWCWYQSTMLHRAIVHLASFAVMGAFMFTDALDGWLARLLDLETNLGRVLDPAADWLGAACIIWSWLAMMYAADPNQAHIFTGIVAICAGLNLIIGYVVTVEWIGSSLPQPDTFGKAKCALYSLGTWLGLYGSLGQFPVPGLIVSNWLAPVCYWVFGLGILLAILSLVSRLKLLLFCR